MILSGVGRLLNVNSNIKTLTERILLLIITSNRQPTSVNMLGVRIARVLYLFVLRFFALQFFLSKKNSLIFQGIELLHFKNDPDGAINKWNEAQCLGQRGVSAIALEIVRLELMTHDEHAVRNCIHILKWVVSFSNTYSSFYQLALLHIRVGNIEDAKPLLLRAIELNPGLSISQQNWAARYDPTSYIPQEFDSTNDPEVHLYDALNVLGQALYNEGNVKEGLNIFGSAVNIQNRLSRRYSLPQHLIDRITPHPLFSPSKTIRIVPYEWVTQIGHLGMLDALIKMSKLGMRPDANWVLLAPVEKVVNQYFLSYWNEYFIILTDSITCNEYLPYQRICGEQFNCYVDEVGRIMDWSDAASIAFRKWDKGRYSPLIEISTSDVEHGRQTMEKLGLPKDAWFVTLHARSRGYYKEKPGHIQDHRNSPIESYLSAIDLVIANGGWVVRVGDSTMPKLPKIDRVIDVAHSALSGRQLDIYLWSKCRFFLGTTSGPTNAVISFNTPCLLVNCVSNYAQSWNSKVLFVLKPFWSRVKNRYLTYKEAFHAELRATMFQTKSMDRVGIEPHSNSKNDILEATKEMLHLVDKDLWSENHDNSLVNFFGAPLSLWGCARPSQNYLALHPELLTSGTDENQFSDEDKYSIIINASQ